MDATTHVGQVALRLGIPRRRVQWWIARGFLQVEPDPAYRRGHYYRVSDEEIRIARAVIEFQARYGVRASAQLFDEMRYGHATAPNPAAESAVARS